MKKGKKRRIVKKRNNLVVVVAVLLAVLILLAVAIIQKTRHKIAVEGLTFKDVSGGSIMSFSLVNKDALPADCTAYLTVNGRKSAFSLGIVKPNSRKDITTSVYMPNGRADYRLEPLCQWKALDIAGCDVTDFKICELARKDSRLKQCLTGTLSQQYFCIAILRMNLSFCAFINPNDKRAKCLAFVGQNPEYCRQLAQPARDSCYEDYGMNKENQTVCYLINSSEKRQACLGVTTQNPALCDGINEDDKMLCIMNLAEFIGDETLCDMMKDPAPCYDKLAWMKPEFTPS